jgi:cytochrome b-561
VTLPPLLPTANGVRMSNGNLNYHATFMTFGFVFLQGEGTDILNRFDRIFFPAILMYRMFRHESKMFSKVLHGVFHLFAFVLIVFGLVAVVMHKNLRKMTHIYSAHSWVGVTLITLFIFQVIISSFVRDRIHNILGSSRREVNCVSN